MPVNTLVDLIFANSWTISMNLPQNKVCNIAIFHGANMIVVVSVHKTVLLSMNIQVHIQDTGSVSQNHHSNKHHSFTVGEFQGSLFTRTCSTFYAFHHHSFQSCQTSCCCDILRWEEVRAHCLSTALRQSVCAAFHSINNLQDVGPCARSRGQATGLTGSEPCCITPQVLFILTAWRCFPRPLCLEAASKRTL